jgi:hypothetical protein
MPGARHPGKALTLKRVWFSMRAARALEESGWGSGIHYFPTQWYIIDEERGWIVCEFMNRMVDPGDGSVHQVKNYTRLEYAGNNMWSLQEDQYNPAAFARMIEGWLKARGEEST